MHNNGQPTVNGEVETSAIRTQGNYTDFVAAITRELSSVLLDKL